MISILSVDRSDTEQTLLKNQCSSQIARRSDERMEFFAAQRPERTGLPPGRMLDILYYELEKEADLTGLRGLRSSQREALLVLLTGPKVSPVQYLRPGIAPSLLMQRPLTAQRVEQAAEELFDAFFEERQAPEEGQVFAFKERDSLVRVRCRDILFFEASNKKINLRTAGEEYGFYDSIERIGQQLPDHFVRCHRAYLVNVDKIRRLRLSENLVELCTGDCLPLSRSCRQEVKEQMK